MQHLRSLRQHLKRTQSTSSKAKRENLIEAATTVQNIFEEFAIEPTLPNCRIERVELYFYWGQNLTKELAEWMFACMLTLRSMYDGSRMAWNSDEKRRELYHPKQRFIVASHPDYGGHFAFLSFRWDIDEHRPVMYVYELFVDDTARGNHVAYALMQIAERLCMACCIPHILLTVFDVNTAALNLYRNRLHYKNDVTCPTRWDIDDAAYQILSKILPGLNSETLGSSSLSEFNKPNGACANK